MLKFEKAISDEMVVEKIQELKSVHPKLASVAERIHEMDLKETVRAILVVDVLEAFLKIHALREAREKILTDETTQRIVNELKGKNPVFAEIVERAHEMDVRETVGAVIVLRALEKFLKIHAARLATE